MTKSRIVVLLTLAAAVAAFFALGLQRYLSLEFFQSQRAAIDAYYAAHPAGTIAGYFALYVTVAALSLPGAAIMTLAGGAIFGFSVGLLVVSFASSVGATLAFLSARFLLRDWVQQRFGARLAPFNAGIEREGAFYLFAMRLVPAFPFFVVNLALGLTRLGTGTFYWVSQLGMLAGTAVFVYAGTELGTFQVSPQLLGALALLGVFPLVAKRLLGAIKARRIYARWAPMRPARYDYNLVVIGAGSAGLVSAYIAAATKARVALVEAHKMGGDCLNTGCVPSKALLRSAKLLSHIARARELGIAEASARVDFADVMDRVRRVVTAIEPHDSIARYTGLGVEVVEGRAQITSPWTVEVQTASGPRALTTKAIVIAAGAKPFVPPIPGLDEVGYLTSDTVWNLRQQPARLVVLGGGPIGSEMTQAFARLGSRVTQVEMAPRLLMREDPDVSALVQARFEREGVRVLTGHTAARFVVEHGEKLLVATHEGAEVRVPFDAVLVAVGRVANTAGYGLEELGIATTAARTVQTDDALQTIYPNIFACGDVAGPFQFTHTAAHQAWYASVNALFGTFRRYAADYRVIPWATFIDPEVARVGLNEQEARAQHVPHTVSTYDLGELDRAIADEEPHGFIKILTTPGTDTILGVTCVGEHAGDLLAEYVLAMKHGLGLNKILGTIHTYPTMAEANKYVAGAWRRSTVTQGQWAFLTAFQAWRRGAGGVGAVARRLPGLVNDKRPAYPPDAH
ncbi:MAG TPA: FAD-dependent oxidoreductase [Vicinamibacterales bacterium]|nr:FAD-dependent oxidoreductase [Vicinamibacterales bacterium]